MIKFYCDLCNKEIEKKKDHIEHVSFSIYLDSLVYAKMVCTPCAIKIKKLINEGKLFETI